MAHIVKNAPDGFRYRYKGADNEFPLTVYIGGGRTEEDYELITMEEYERILAEKEESEQHEDMHV